MTGAIYTMLVQAILLTALALNLRRTTRRRAMMFRFKLWKLARNRTEAEVLSEDQMALSLITVEACVCWCCALAFFAIRELL